MLRRLLLLACGLNCFAISGALAQDTVPWRTVGQWQIRVDASLGYGCFLVGSYTRGTLLRIGIDQQNGNGYVMVGNEAWRSLQVGSQYDLALRFDNAAPWRGRATARRIGSGDMVFLYLSFDRSRFLVELARRLNLHIFYGGELVTQLPLHGTNAAVQEMIRCQQAADTARKNNRPQGDPFAGSPQNPKGGPSGGGGGGPSFRPGGPSGPSGPGGGPSPDGPGPGGPSSGPGPGGPSGPGGPGPGGPSAAPDAPSSPGGPTFRPSPGGR